MSASPRVAVSARRRALQGLGTLALALLLTACAGGGEASSTRRPERGEIEVGEPYPYTDPAPPEEPTPIDGTYTRTITVEQAGGPPVYCQRCAPWRLDAGDAVLSFDRGAMRAAFEPIRVEVDCASDSRNVECKHPPGFEVSAHYRIDGDRVEIFNDPNCIGMTGVYEWEVSDDALVLDVVEDECPFVRLRAKYLTAAPWDARGA